MKAKFLTRMMSVLTVAWALQSSALDYVLVQNPTSLPKDAIGLKEVEDFVYDLSVPGGTRVVHILSLGTRCETIANLIVPKLPNDGILGRKFRLDAEIKAAKARLAAAAAVQPAGGCGILLPTVQAHLRDLAFSSAEVSVLIEGSPFFVSTSPRIDLLKYYPLDGVLALGPERSRLGMAHLAGAFRSNSITWHLPAVELEVESQRSIQRFLTLAASKSGAALVNWTTDRPAATGSWRSPSSYSAQRFEVRPAEAAQLRPYKLVPLVCTGVDPRLVEAIEELRKSGVTRCVAGAWQCMGDVDVHLDCSRQYAGEPEVYFGRTNSVHLRFLGDKTKATGKGFEICAMEGDVDPAQLRYSLNLYKAAEPVRGEAVLLLDGVLYRQEFAFPAEARGDAGKDGGSRATSPNWLAVRMSELLAHPVE